jgi:hypothetical protein
MTDKQQASRRKRRRARKSRATAPRIIPSSTAELTKHIAYLHVHCQMEPEAIAARYRNALTLADVFCALSYYFRDQESIDAEIQRELAFMPKTRLVEH